MIAPCIALEPVSTVTPGQSPLPGITTSPISPAPTQSPEVQDNSSASVVRPKSVDESGDLTPGEEKISTALLLETNETSGNPGGNSSVSDAGLQIKTVPVPPSTDPGVVEKIPSGKLVYVYITTRPGYSTHCVDSLVADVKNRNEDYHLVVGWADVANLESIAELEGVQNIRQVTPPRVHKGINTTQGDIVHKTANVRSTYGYTGSGMKIGIISDGVDHLADSQATGDLPANVHVLRNTKGGDEGTAMLEIVYNMVPDADLYFHDCGTNVLAFNDAIANLKAAGCTVICDDIGWSEEPFFEDGIIASNVTTLLAGNQVVYVSSAGNDAAAHYQGAFYDRGTGYTDFSRGTATSKSLYVKLLPNASVNVVLEWDDKFGQSGNDYNLYLSNSDNTTFTYGDLAYSENVQSGTGNPFESLSYKNTGNTTINGTIDVFKYRGVTKTLELFIYRGGSGTTIYSDNIVAADSIFGHPAVPDAIAVAAVDQSTPSTIESFSSWGPVTIAYPSAQVRPKPDIAGVDGVNITGAGGFSNPFYGTSAAAPHIAAVVGQIWGAHRDLTPAQVRSALYNSAVHLGTPGKNTVFGYGRADALAMATLTLPVVSLRPDGGDDGPVSLARKEDVSRTEIVNVGGGSAVTRASMTGTGLGKNLVVTAMPRSTLPSAMAAPPTTVYQYMSISTSTITGVVSETTLDFVVPQSWLTEHGFDEGDIVLLHNVEGTWQTLPTRLVSRSGDNVFYRATTPGFSYFAIAFQKGGTDRGAVTPVQTTAPTSVAVAVTTASETQTPVPVYSPAPVARTPAVTGTVPPAPPAPVEGLPFATIALGFIGVLVIIIAAFLVRRWWIRRQNPALFRKYD